MTAPVLVENFFRHEYAKLVATLSRLVGVKHFESIEDAAQHALMTALEVWKHKGLPDNPSAWVYRVAHNRLLSELRSVTRRNQILALGSKNGPPPSEGDHQLVFDNEVKDDQLRMMFICCDEAVPVESQLAFALKTLCGFDVGEIAQRLFTSEANIYKRISRAKTRLRDTGASFTDLRPEHYAARRPAVLKVVYLVFTEGYLSSHPDAAIRRELCVEAIRLGTLLAEHPLGRSVETFALLALMHLHSARFEARVNELGGLLLLEEQDRSKWDAVSIQTGLWWLAESARGDAFSRYHAEAGIAAEHCLAATFDETRWDKIIEYYELLNRVAPSPLNQLNAAVALAEHQGPRHALAYLEGQEPPTWLEGSYLWAAVLADLHRRCGNLSGAERHRCKALELAPSSAVADLLARRLGTPS